MHEASLVKNLMQTITAIAQEQNVTKVIAVKVRLGALSHMSAEHFSEHFAIALQASEGIASQRTLMEGARLDIETSDDLSDPMAQDIFLESLEVETS
jgi:hydrogenase nickel incorporation protein HypA/HybF